MKIFISILIAIYNYLFNKLLKYLDKRHTEPCMFFLKALYL